MELYTLIGPSGSGKTSLAKWCRLLAPGNIHWVSSDEIRKELFGDDLREVQTRAHHERVFTLFHKRIAEAMEKGSPVISDATNLTRQSRAKALELAKANGYKPIAFLFEASTETLMDRQSRRVQNEQVPREAVEKHISRFDLITEEALLTEGFDEVVDGTALLNEVQRLHSVIEG